MRAAPVITDSSAPGNTSSVRMPVSSTPVERLAATTRPRWREAGRRLPVPSATVRVRLREPVRVPLMVSLSDMAVSFRWEAGLAGGWGLRLVRGAVARVAGGPQDGRSVVHVHPGPGRSLGDGHPQVGEHCD